MNDYFQRSRALRFLTAGREISVVYNRHEWDARMGWKPVQPLRNAESWTIWAWRSCIFSLFFCLHRGDRCREIPSVRDVTYRGVAGMMLLHDLLHILPPLPSQNPPPQKTMHTAMMMRCVSAMCALKVICARVVNCALILTTPEAITSS